jgi:hypothetical protein
VDDPIILQFVTELLDASLINRMVEVPEVAEALAFIMVRSFPAFNPFILPFMVTFLAPFKSMSGAARVPLMYNPVNVG